ncbi:MAG: YidH family protein [Mycobacteriales bacterium]
MPEHEDSRDSAERDEPEQIVLMQRMVDLSILRTSQSAERSELSAERSYMNAERTLSVWIRTALAVTVLGLAVDRFGLLLSEDHVGRGRTDTGSHAVGAGLVAFGVLMSVVTAVRFRRYAADYRRRHELPYHHGPFMAPAFAALTAAFGIVILVLLLTAS